MKRVKPLFAVGVPGLFAAGLLTIFVIGQGSASAQTPRSTPSAARAAFVSHLRAVAGASNARPVSGDKDPSPIPTGWTCSGNCGTDGADGTVTLSPTTNSAYEWVSTNGGITGVGALPIGALGSETDGSTLSTPVFTATAGSPLQFYFNYVTADGGGFADYAWAELFNAANTPVALLFTARTVASGSVIPGTGMPTPLATLTPASVPIIGGAPTWGPLGSSSGTCYTGEGPGCGYTGWVRSNYTIATAGNYYLEIGVTNWIDQSVDSGLAMDGVTINGVALPTTVPGIPVPPSVILMMLGLATLGAFFFATQKFARS